VQPVAGPKTRQGIELAAPFDAAQAKRHQVEWAAYLKVPVEFTNSIGMKFRLIPPGEFTMGMTKEEAEAIARFVRPGDHVIDVGAHVGYFSAMMSDIVGEDGLVVSFEPSPDNYNLLVRNMKPRFNVITRQAMVSSAYRRAAKLHLSAYNSGDNRSTHFREATRQVSVECVTLDGVYDEFRDTTVFFPSFIKIDTQGADHQVVMGAKHLIRNERPVILLEHWPDGLTEMSLDHEKIYRSYKRLAKSYSYVLEHVGDESKGYYSILMIPMERTTNDA
jgi:FkbM family methyltransferase